LGVKEVKCLIIWDGGSSYLALLTSGMHMLVKLIVMDKGEFHSDLFTIRNNAKGVEKTTPGKINK
jgi:hypothetical protein